MDMDMDQGGRQGKVKFIICCWLLLAAAGMEGSKGSGTRIK